MSNRVLLDNYILFSKPIGSINRNTDPEVPKHKLNGTSVLRQHGHHVNNVDDWTVKPTRQMLSRHGTDRNTRSERKAMFHCDFKVMSANSQKYIN